MAMRKDDWESFSGLRPSSVRGILNFRWSVRGILNFQWSVVGIRD